MYDLRDRALPPWVDRREPDPDAAMRALLEISSKALGICTPAQVAHYFHAKQADARPLIDRLIAEGRFVTVTARLADGATGELVVHRDNLPLLQRAADGDLRPRRTTFLSPFDSLFWANGRDLQLWRFRQVLECYKPQPQREWGYFCLPILDRDRLVGRLRPQAGASHRPAAAQEPLPGTRRRAQRPTGGRRSARPARLHALPRRQRPRRRAQRTLPTSAPS